MTLIDRVVAYVLEHPEATALPIAKALGEEHERVVRAIAGARRKKRLPAGRCGVVDLTGQRFGRLVVVELYGKNEQGRAVWLCKCDCGVIKPIVSSSLRRGNSTSCGCLVRGTAYQAARVKRWRAARQRNIARAAALSTTGVVIKEKPCGKKAS